MRGFVRTPDAVVDLMVAKVFASREPVCTDHVLDAGCGDGAFVAGILRHCEAKRQPVPRIVGVEQNDLHAANARLRFHNIPQVEIRSADFLLQKDESFDYIIGNPPYVPITSLEEGEKLKYRQSFRSAAGRFDLYLLFLEKALRQLRPKGRLVFITPEKFLFVDTATPMRRLLSDFHVAELHFLREETFAGLVTYPLITTIDNVAVGAPTRVCPRQGDPFEIDVLAESRSWQPVLSNRGQALARRPEGHLFLEDLCARVSCGVATGADGVFVIEERAIAEELHTFSYSTLSGRQLQSDGALRPKDRILVPYSREGELLSEKLLGSLGTYLREPSRRKRLEARTCVRRKPWYAFHETPPMADLLRPKILCKDIAAMPFFAVDKTGEFIPRHSLYYVVPKTTAMMGELADYLNSDEARRWLTAHCQRAANGFLRLQSHVLKRLPVPSHFERLLAADGVTSSAASARSA